MSVGEMQRDQLIGEVEVLLREYRRHQREEFGGSLHLICKNLLKY